MACAPMAPPMLDLMTFRSCFIRLASLAAWRMALKNSTTHVTSGKMNRCSGKKKACVRNISRFPCSTRAMMHRMTMSPTEMPTPWTSHLSISAAKVSGCFWVEPIMLRKVMFGNASHAHKKR